MIKFTIALASAFILLLPTTSLAQRCLYVSSYHQGYAWSDAVEEGLRATLGDQCELKQFDMDTKRKKSLEEKKEAAITAKTIIEDWQPDIVITSDDNAARYLIMQYYRDASLPFVFCGVNWTVEEYGFPYTNVTGMIEVAPIKPMLETAADIAGNDKGILYIGANTATERKNYDRFVTITRRMGLGITEKLVDSPAEWIEAYRSGAGFSFVALGSNAGIPDWSEADVLAALEKIPGVLTVTSHEWMMPYSAFGLTKIPQEHGEWAAAAALAILSGTPPSEIPVVSNRRWNTLLNESRWLASGYPIPQQLRLEATPR
ncbi:MAG: ABC transporter substrate-binding protein [bacterium]